MFALKGLALYLAAIAVVYGIMITVASHVALY